MAHCPDVRFPDRAIKDNYVAHLKELGQRPQVYIKLSEVVHKSGDKVSTDLSTYKEWLDELWSIFGEDRVMFGSDWPQSESLEFNSYPNVIAVAGPFVAPRGLPGLDRVFGKKQGGP